MITKMMCRKKKAGFDGDAVFTPSEEANICLTCPLDSCKKNRCKRFDEEKRKLKEAKRNAKGKAR